MPSESKATHPAAAIHPRLALRVGVLGNRKIGEQATPPVPGHADAMESALREAARAVFGAIRETLIELQAAEAESTFPKVEPHWKWLAARMAGDAFGHEDRWGREGRSEGRANVFRDQPPLVKILTGRAEGADQWLEGIALSFNDQTPSVAFEAVPVIVEEGEGVHAPAGAFSVGRIPAVVSPGPNRTRSLALEAAKIAEARARGHRSQAEALRHHSDLLVAAWDPAAEGKSGGTAETAALALAENIPVIALRFDQECRMTLALLERVSELRSKAGVVWTVKDANQEFTAIRELVTRLLAFPDAPISRDSRSNHGGRRRHRADPREPFTTYDPRVAFHSVITMTDLGTPWPANLWSCFIHAVNRLPWTSPPGSAPAAATELTASHFYSGTRNRIASLSRVFGNAYRGAVLVSYILGAAAVALSVLGLFLHLGGTPAWAPWGLGAVEFGILALLAMLAFVAHVESWHEFYTDTRVLAEALRCMNYLGPLGVHTPIPKLPPYLAGGRAATLKHDPRRSWAVWYLRALIREAPLRWPGNGNGSEIPAARMKELLTRHWVGSPEGTLRHSQVDYHRRTGATHRVIFEGIEWATRGTFLIVLVALGVHLAAMAFEGDAWAVVHAGGRDRAAEGSGLERAFEAIGVLAPAILAALGGFLAQIGSRRLMQQSESMEQTLLDRFTVLESVNTDDPGSVDSRWLLPREAAITAARMVDEAAGWALIYKNSDIHVG